MNDMNLSEMNSPHPTTATTTTTKSSTSTGELSINARVMGSTSSLSKDPNTLGIGQGSFHTEGDLVVQGSTLSLQEGGNTNKVLNIKTSGSMSALALNNSFNASGGTGTLLLGVERSNGENISPLGTTASLVNSPSLTMNNNNNNSNLITSSNGNLVSSMNSSMNNSTSLSSSTTTTPTTTTAVRTNSVRQSNLSSNSIKGNGSGPGPSRRPGSKTSIPPPPSGLPPSQNSSSSIYSNSGGGTGNGNGNGGVGGIHSRSNSSRSSKSNDFIIPPPPPPMDGGNTMNGLGMGMGIGNGPPPVLRTHRTPRKTSSSGSLPGLPSNDIPVNYSDVRKNLKTIRQKTSIDAITQINAILTSVGSNVIISPLTTKPSHDDSNISTPSSPTNNPTNNSNSNSNRNSIENGGEVEIDFEAVVKGFLSMERMIKDLKSRVDQLTSPI